MEQYTLDRYRSRNIDIGEQPLPCEMCLYQLIFDGNTKGVSPIDDIHHVCPGAKTRQYKKDGSDLLGLCKSHHISQHNENGWSNIQLLLEIVKESIIIFRRMGCKEKLWALVEFLHDKQIDDKINGIH